MRPLGNYYSREVKMWLRNIPGREVTQSQIGKILGLACAQAATLKTAVSAFNKKRIYPTNPSDFGEEVFIASDTTKGFISEIPQPGTSLKSQPTAEPTGSHSGISVAEGLD
jgi:hypothetical protein